MSFQFSNDQLTAIDNIYTQLLDTTPINVHSLAVLTGAAGTGKTTVVG